MIGNFNARAEKTWEVIQKTAETHDVWVDQDEVLLTEITCLVEWPVGLCGKFEEKFLLTLNGTDCCNERAPKILPTRAQTGELTNRFIIVSNIESKDENQVIAGNQRLLSETFGCKILLRTDRKHTLDLEEIGLINYISSKIGFSRRKNRALKKLSEQIARSIGVTQTLCIKQRSSHDATWYQEMVLEFDELQGRIGTLYATLEQENPDVAQAIQGLYQPRGASDSIPDDLFGSILALADRLDTLAGLFAIDQPPTGRRTPLRSKSRNRSIEAQRTDGVEPRP